MTVDRSRKEIKLRYRHPEIRTFMALDVKRNPFSFECSLVLKIAPFHKDTSQKMAILIFTTVRSKISYKYTDMFHSIPILPNIFEPPKVKLRDI
jgi:hypothetical protein